MLSHYCLPNGHRSEVVIVEGLQLVEEAFHTGCVEVTIIKVKTTDGFASGYVQAVESGVALEIMSVLPGSLC